MTVKNAMFSLLAAGCLSTSCTEPPLSPAASQPKVIEQQKNIQQAVLIGSWQGAQGSAYIYVDLMQQYYRFYNALSFSADSFVYTDYTSFPAKYSKGVYTAKTDTIFFKGSIYTPESQIFVKNSTGGISDSLIGIKSTNPTEFAWKCETPDDSTLAILSGSNRILFKKTHK